MLPITHISLRASPNVSTELKFPVELNSTGSFNFTGTVGDERRLTHMGAWAQNSQMMGPFFGRFSINIDVLSKIGEK